MRGFNGSEGRRRRRRSAGVRGLRPCAGHHTGRSWHGRAALAGDTRVLRCARARGSGRRPHRVPCSQRGRSLQKLCRGAGPRAPARGAGECAAGRVGCRQRSAGPLAPATALADAAVPTAGLYGGGGALGAHTTAALTVACRQAIGPPQICSNTISVRRIR